MFSVMRPINSFLVWRPNEMNMGRTWFLEVWLYVCVCFFFIYCGVPFCYQDAMGLLWGIVR